MAPQLFEGFIDDARLQDGRLTVRVVAGGFDPRPSYKPVLLVRVEGPQAAEAAIEALGQLRNDDDGVYVWPASPTSVGFQSDHGQEIVVSGSSVTMEEQEHAARDFERLATLNYQRSLDQDAAFSRQAERLTAVTDLLRQQLQRVSAKAEGHAIGSTARTLYAQHLDFLARALAAAEA